MKILIIAPMWLKHAFEMLMLSERSVLLLLTYAKDPRKRFVLPMTLLNIIIIQKTKGGKLLGEQPGTQSALRLGLLIAIQVDQDL